MSINGNKRKSECLGMPHGTATSKLRKMLLFQFAKRCGEDECFHCGRKIETLDQFSIEHKEPWIDNAELFWDLSNIAFSHLSCNSSRARRHNLFPIGEWARTNLVKTGEPGTAWCTGCQDFHPREEFSLNRSRREGLQDTCRASRSRYRSPGEVA